VQPTYGKFIPKKPQKPYIESNNQSCILFNGNSILSSVREKAVNCVLTVNVFFTNFEL